MRRLLLIVLLALPACEEGPPPDPVRAGAGAAPQIVPAAPRLSRLTRARYLNSLRDLLGDDLALPSALEPDVEADGLLAIGAGTAAVSPRGIELYEDAAFHVAEQVMGDPARRKRVVPCTPAGTADAACARAFVEQLGRRAWRRPLVAEEVEPLVEVATAAARTLDDFHGGLAYALAALLQSPSFLYRVEVGAPGPDGVRRHTGYEMASRLSYFLWNTTPDDLLLAAAESGALDTPAGVAAQARRLIDDPRARQGVRNLFAEYLDLRALDELRKDPNVYKHFSADLGGLAREETLRVIEHLVFEADADYRELLTTRQTFLDRRLAAIYNVPAAGPEGFGAVELPADGPRVGLLGHVSVLARFAHPVSTSPTLRGRFIRDVLLCQPLPPPPANLNTALPEPDARARTLRERLDAHRTDPFCANCHAAMDPPGLGLEQFDGVGRFRLLDNDEPIDPSGELDGVPFADARELAEVVAAHERLVPCLVDRVFGYATGREPSRQDAAVLADLERQFAEEGHRVKALLYAVATSEAFRRVGAPQ